MFDELSKYYFGKALALAINDDLSRAVQYAAASIGISSAAFASPPLNNETGMPELMDSENEEGRKLAGLCYYKLGNYVMAEYCFNNSSYYNENIKEMLSKKKEQMNNIKELAGKQQYKNAVKQLENDADKNVNEYNYLGCLYAVLHKKDKALMCFLEALKEDKSNKDAMNYIKNIQSIKKRWWWA